MNTLPETNETYGDQDYWTKRFETEEPNEWLLDYQQFKHYFNKYVDKNESILILGCGNSLVGEKLLDDGYNLVFSMDYCENVVTKMSNHCAKCNHQVNWLTMDATKMAIKDEAFDVVFEKATIDTFLVKEKSLWSISESTLSLIDQVLTQVSRVLRSQGKFISLSFNQPHFRGPLYSSAKYNWAIQEIESLGDDFHHYLYIMKKDLSPLESQCKFAVYEPAKVVKEAGADQGDNSQENDVFNIIL